ncbi:MAG: 4-hydroxy-3-methylbut-2-enyl diphosphate reductase [Candidatus Zixiibacteriota bacterium]|nr:MAG: 4-hydroxy-3-methylbut-2-enyl diphosphate reductase [candidate division Zixibacteria bacterium]
MKQKTPRSERSRIASLKKIIIATHYGFCMGVKRAIAIARETAGKEGKVTILKEIVHNDAVVESFKQKGVGQAESIDQIDSGTVIIPAHGASPDVFQKAEARGLRIVDATCPLVIRIHKIVKKLAQEGYRVLHFGDPDHDETIGIVGRASQCVEVIPGIKALRALPEYTGKLALTSQTTARSADFAAVEKVAKRRFPHIEIFNTICNATNQRQQAILELGPRADLILVVGSPSSANSKRLVKISRGICPEAYLINSPDDIQPEWFGGSRKTEIVGLSAGASTPNFLIAGAIERLREMSSSAVEVVYPKPRVRRNRPMSDRIRKR